MDMNNHTPAYNDNKLFITTSNNSSSPPHWDLQTAAMEHHPHNILSSHNNHTHQTPTTTSAHHHHHHHNTSSLSFFPYQTPSSLLNMISTNHNHNHHHHHEAQDNNIQNQANDQYEHGDDDHDQEEGEEEEELGAMKEMMYKIAAMQPVDIDPATIRKPKRRNVRISDDPQSVAARHRRERISERIRILQRLVPGGTKMDTATMLDEAIRYVKFLKRQIRLLQASDDPTDLQRQELVQTNSTTSTHNNNTNNSTTTPTQPCLSSPNNINWGTTTINTTAVQAPYGSLITTAPPISYGVFGRVGSSLINGETLFYNTTTGFNHSDDHDQGIKPNRDVTFQAGEHVFPRVLPMKGIRRFGKKGKLSPRFIGPFQILEKVGQVAYRLALPPALPTAHDVFHISMLRKYVSNPTHILSYEALELQSDLSYEEQHVQILDRKEKFLRNKTIALVKVLWRNSKVEEATWELEFDMRTQHPELFKLDFKDEILLTRG